MGWTGRAPAPNDRQNRFGDFEARGVHAVPFKHDVAVVRAIGIDTGKNTLHMIGLKLRRARSFCVRKFPGTELPHVL
jgi:hypothetical protein